MNTTVPGNVAWFEVNTQDVESTKQFYSELFGWTFAAVPIASDPQQNYIMITAQNAQQPMGGIQQASSNIPKGIMLAIRSENVQAGSKRLVLLGAKIIHKPTQVNDVTFAIMQDPFDNLFSIFNCNGLADQTSTPPVLGSFTWFEVGTCDIQATQEFYQAAFNWQFSQYETGTDRPYFSIAINNEDPTGGMADHSLSTKNQNYLIPYFLVSDVTTIACKTQKLGGQVINAPTCTASGLVHACLLDNQGNLFGVFSQP
ncbi:VOC family protein [Zooshikella ganghwensis]|uniref:VOC family protein n=1 Tax=Zooshikella ganghwensis TaxID=202772 RepID=A0A4P9VKK0_9GAMM|nr:VOC family protein [Zooshikella ganghwensis]RDH42817.1 VOC family protein [Zooshikella ganghwensis]